MIFIITHRADENHFLPLINAIWNKKALYKELFEFIATKSALLRSPGILGFFGKISMLVNF